MESYFAFCFFCLLLDFWLASCTPRPWACKCKPPVQMKSIKYSIDRSARFFCDGSVWYRELTNRFLFLQTPVELCWRTERGTAELFTAVLQIIQLLRGLHVQYLTYKNTTKMFKTLWSFVTVSSYSQINQSITQSFSNFGSLGMHRGLQFIRLIY